MAESCFLCGRRTCLCVWLRGGCSVRWAASGCALSSVQCNAASTSALRTRDHRYNSPQSLAYFFWPKSQGMQKFEVCLCSTALVQEPWSNHTGMLVALFHIALTVVQVLARPVHILELLQSSFALHHYDRRISARQGI